MGGFFHDAGPGSNAKTSVRRNAVKPTGRLRRASANVATETFRSTCSPTCVEKSNVHLATVLPPHAPRPTPGPAGSDRSQTLPRWLLPATDRRIAKTERGPISTSDPSILLCTEPGDSYGKINPFFLARRRWTVDHSLAAGGAPRQGLQACLSDAHQTQCLLSRCSP